MNIPKPCILRAATLFTGLVLAGVPACGGGAADKDEESEGPCPEGCPGAGTDITEALNTPSGNDDPCVFTGTQVTQPCCQIGAITVTQEGAQYSSAVTVVNTTENISDDAPRTPTGGSSVHQKFNCSALGCGDGVYEVHLANPEGLECSEFEPVSMTIPIQ